MTNDELVMHKFRDRAVKRGGLLLFSGRDALCVIDEARLQGIKVLGIDGFYLFEKATQPSLEDSIDFTVNRQAVKSDLYDTAAAFIKRHANQGLHFEIVLAPERQKSLG